MTNTNQPSPRVAPSSSGKSARTPSRLSLTMRSPVLKHLRPVMIAGLLTAIPLFITVYVLNLAYALVTRYTRDPANWIANKLLTPWAGEWITPTHLQQFTAPILAILISLLIVYALGLLSTFFVGRKILAQLEHVISNLPLIKGIYGTTKQVMAVFRQGGGGAGFQRVVLVQFPRAGTWTVAFVTNTVRDPVSGQSLICCFIPMTPNPTSGFFQMFPETDVRDTDWTVDLGIKIVLSGGLLAPPVLDQCQSKTTPKTSPP